jgi:hypothetical protein
LVSSMIVLSCHVKPPATLQATSSAGSCIYLSPSFPDLSQVHVRSIFQCSSTKKLLTNQ